MCTSSVSNVIYHKFSHGAAFYTLNGKNVNVMLESCFTLSAASEPVYIKQKSRIALISKIKWRTDYRNMRKGIVKIVENEDIKFSDNMDAMPHRTHFLAVSYF